MLSPPQPRTFSVNEVQVSSYENSVRDALTFLANPPICFVTQGATQSLTNSTWTAITQDQTVTDTYGGHSNVTNPSRYVSQAAGWYALFGCSSYAGNATGNRGTAGAKNGSRIQGGVGFFPTITVGNSPTAPSPPCIVYLNAGDYAEVYGYQTSGGSLATNAAADLDSSMTVIWLHA